jgi:periplasmic protein TonB
MYVDKVSQLINHNKIYPKEAIDREEEGKVVVAVTLNSAGQILAAEVEEKSPYPLLNDAALQTVRSIKRFPPFPQILTETLHLHIPLIYKIESR